MPLELGRGLPIAKDRPAHSERSAKVLAGSSLPHWPPGCSLNVSALLPPWGPLPRVPLSLTTPRLLITSSEGPSRSSKRRGPAPPPYLTLLCDPRHRQCSTSFLVLPLLLEREPRGAGTWSAWCRACLSADARLFPTDGMNEWQLHHTPLPSARSQPLQASVRRHLFLQDAPPPRPHLSLPLRALGGDPLCPSLPTEPEQLTRPLLPCTRPLIPKLTHIMVDLQLLEDERLRLRVQGGRGGPKPAGICGRQGELPWMGGGKQDPWSRDPASETSNCLPASAPVPSSSIPFGKESQVEAVVWIRRDTPGGSRGQGSRLEATGNRWPADSQSSAPCGARSSQGLRVKGYRSAPGFRDATGVGSPRGWGAEGPLPRVSPSAPSRADCSASSSCSCSLRSASISSISASSSSNCEGRYASSSSQRPPRARFGGTPGPGPGRRLPSILWGKPG